MFHSEARAAGLARAGVALRRAATFVAAAASIVVACAGETRGEVRVTDDAGQSMVLARPAARIVSLAPHVTELLFSAGAGHRIVGAVRFSDYPPAARAIPRIGDSFSLDGERIVALKPDLAIVWLHGNAGGQIAQLRRLGIPVFASEPRTLAEIASTIRRFGALAAVSPDAERAALAFETKVATLRAQFATRPPVRVFYQVSGRPLLTINRQHLIDDVIRLCGGANVFGDLAPLVPAVSAEAVVAADPEAIVAAGGEPGNEDGFAQWEKIAQMTATRRGNFVLLSSDTISRQSERIADGAAALCRALETVRSRRGPSRSRESR